MQTKAIWNLFEHMGICQLCKQDTVTQTLDFDLQPVCNRFLASRNEEEYRHPLVAGQCPACGLVQLIDPPPAAKLLPVYNWIMYNEPEDHLDELARIITHLPNLSEDSSICGISFKDDSTLERVEKLGLRNTRRLHPEKDLGIREPWAGIETIQERLTPVVAAQIAEEQGTSDVVIARHVVEHSMNLQDFMGALERLTHPLGHIVIEVPDCSRSLDKLDVTALWEEHTCYFTLGTFRNLFACCGLALTRLDSYPYPFENSLVGIAHRQRIATNSSFPPGIVKAEMARAQAFSQGLAQRGRRLKKFLSDFRGNQGKIALLGAGHLACTFINLFGLGDLIELVVDDNSHKQGLFMPGSRLPILSSAALLEHDIKLCLLSLNPLTEDRVIQKNSDFLERGGSFYSIFPNSRHALSV